MERRLVLRSQGPMVAAGAAAILAVSELVLSFGTEVAWAAWVVAALFAVGAVLIARAIARTAGLVLVAALFVMELAFVPVYSHDSLGDWFIQGAIALVSVIGLVASVASLMTRRGSRLAHR